MSEKMIERKRQQMGISPPSTMYSNHTHPGGMGMGNPNMSVRPNGAVGPYGTHNSSQYPHLQQIPPQNPNARALAMVTAQDTNLESFLNLLTYSSTTSSSILPPAMPANTTTSVTGIANTSNISSGSNIAAAQTAKPQHNHLNSTAINTLPLTPEAATAAAIASSSFLPSLPPPPPPTVPTPLTRRIMQTQGCSYLDPNISTVMSHAADHFLATVLSQALACRDLRIRGEDLRKRLHRNETIERRKRKREWMERHVKKRKKEEKKEEKWMEDIERARKLKEMEEQRRMMNDGSAPAFKGDGTTGSTKGNKSGSNTSKRKLGSGSGSSKKKNQTQQLNLDNGSGSKNGVTTNQDEEKDNLEEDDDISLNSLEVGDLDDNAFYHNEDSDLSSNDDEDDEEDDDENRDILLLRDLERPIQAWGMTFAGKLGLSANDIYQAADFAESFQNPGDRERGGDKTIDGNNPSAGFEGKDGKIGSGAHDGKSISSSSMVNSSATGKPGVEGSAKTAMDVKMSTSASGARTAIGTNNTSNISGLDKRKA